MKTRLSRIQVSVVIAGAMLLNVASWAADIEYPGFIKVENFDQIAGDPVANLLAAAKYTNNLPDSVTFLSTLYWARNPAADNYGSRITGFITPQETAAYVFFVASDNDSSLYLSTDATPANLKLIAADQGWQNARTWTGAGGTSSGDGTTNVVFRRGRNPGPDVLLTNGFQWVGPFQNRSDEFLNSPSTNLLASAAQRWPTTDGNGNAVINLVANQKYYFQYLFKEGGGGDNAGVAWKKAGDPDPLNGDPEIQSPFLSVISSDTLTIRTQPTNTTVSEGQIVNFRVDVLGVPGDSDTTLFTYQWYANNVAISDGTGNAATYTILSAAASDNGKQYKVTITSAGTSPAGILNATSSVATLTVVSDPVPPRISRIRSSDSFASAKITYSEAVRNEAVDPANYVFSGGLTVTDANFDIVADAATEDPKNPLNPLNRVAVILFTSTQTAGATYPLTINNVKDLIGNNLAPNNTTTMYANVFQPGILSFKRWIGGGNLQALVNNPLRYANPNESTTLTTAETAFFRYPNDEDYMALVSGFFIPTVTTNYVFFACADNDGFLYLSTDADIANRKLIAADVGWQNQRVWTGPGGDTAKRRGDGVGGGPFENRSDQLLTSARAIAGTGLPFGALPLVPSDAQDPEPWPTTDGSGNAVISLTASNRYAFQLWHQEFDGGRVEATFKFVGEPDPADGTVSRITSGLIGAYVDPTSLLPVITAQPTNVNFTVGGPINFYVTATSSLPISYQWYGNGVAIPNATNSTLTINNATAANLGAYYVAVSNENGPVNSVQALALTTLPPPGLTFQQDGTGMLVIEAEHYFAAATAPDGHLWVPLSSRAGYSGPGYMQVLPDSGVNAGNASTLTNGARLDLRAAFSTAGTNYVWIRGGDPTAGGAGDSVHVGIDGLITAGGTQVSGTPTFNTTSWNWVGNIQGDTRTYVVVDAPGTHTINLWMREDGFLMDKIILTTDSAFTPTGTGPAESAVVSPGPVLSIGRNGANIVITYTGTLLSAPTVNGSYTPVSGASGGSYTVSPTNTQQYFRAQQ